MIGLELRNVSKVFARKIAVDRLNLHVGEGTVVGLIGPNGSGKTTTISMILGLTRPTSGEIVIKLDGHEKDWNDLRGRVGVSLEVPMLYPRLSVMENLQLVARIRGVSPVGIDSLINEVGLDNAGGKPTSQFSLGMRQRLSLASALLGSPDLIILDEPTNGLDPQGIRYLRDALLERKSKQTVLLATHLLSELERICTHVAVMIDGRIVQQGAVEDLLSDNFLVFLSAKDIQQLEAAASACPLISKVECRGHGIVASVSRANLSELNAYFAQQTIFLSELTPIRRSLEDVFLDAASLHATKRGQ